MFDLTVVSSFWPKGLFLSKKLAERGQKVCYINLKQEAPAPFGLFLQEEDYEEKVFLESLGQLLKQEGGFCLLSPEGHWSFQEIDWQNLDAPALQKARARAFGDFRVHWTSFLSRNLMSRAFEGNQATLSTQGLDFFSDYFLFEATSKQKNQFKISNPEIEYLEMSLEDIKVTQGKSKASFWIQGKEVESLQFLWLSNEENLLNLCGLNSGISPEWEWKSFSFEGALGDYEDIIPSHFMSLKDLSLPWTHDNLLSVFHRDPSWDVWVRQPYAREDENLLDLVLVHLNKIFKQAISFKVIPRKKARSFCVYGKDKIQQKHSIPKNITLPVLTDFFQGDFFHQLKYEKQLLEKGVLAQ